MKQQKVSFPDHNLYSCQISCKSIQSFCHYVCLKVYEKCIGAKCVLGSPPPLSLYCLAVHHQLMYKKGIGLQCFVEIRQTVANLSSIKTQEFPSLGILTITTEQREVCVCVCVCIFIYTHTH